MNCDINTFPQPLELHVLTYDEIASSVKRLHEQLGFAAVAKIRSTKWGVNSYNENIRHVEKALKQRIDWEIGCNDGFEKSRIMDLMILQNELSYLINAARRLDLIYPPKSYPTQQQQQQQPATTAASDQSKPAVAQTSAASSPSPPVMNAATNAHPHESAAIQNAKPATNNTTYAEPNSSTKNSKNSNTSNTSNTKNGNTSTKNINNTSSNNTSNTDQQVVLTAAAEEAPSNNASSENKVENDEYTANVEYVKPVVVSA